MCTSHKSFQKEAKTFKRPTICKIIIKKKKAIYYVLKNSKVIAKQEVKDKQKEKFQFKISQCNIVLCLCDGKRSFIISRFS